MVPAWLGVSVLARVAAPVKLILDTDMGGGACRDVDDVVALCRKQDPPYFGQPRAAPSPGQPRPLSRMCCTDRPYRACLRHRSSRCARSTR